MANPRRVYTENEEKIIIKEYCENNKGLAYCGKLIHSNPNTVKKFLVSQGIYVRSAQETLALREESWNRKYPVKDDYFSSPDEKMAYFLGFIAADGYIAKNKHNLYINLAIADKDFLQLFFNEIGGRPIREYQNSDGHYFCSWSCASRQIARDLEQYNIINNKTFVYTFPTNLPKEYWKDFIRGYFDGDGCISEDNTGMKFRIGSASKDTLEKISQYFSDYCGIELKRIGFHDRKNSVEYTLQYRTQDAITIFHHLYYDGCKLYLPRKYDKFKELIDKRITSKRLHILKEDKEIR